MCAVLSKSFQLRKAFIVDIWDFVQCIVPLKISQSVASVLSCQQLQQMFEGSDIDPILRTQSFLKTVRRKGVLWFNQIQCIYRIKSFLVKADIKSFQVLHDRYLTKIEVPCEEWTYVYDYELLRAVNAIGYAEFDAMKNDPLCRFMLAVSNEELDKRIKVLVANVIRSRFSPTGKSQVWGPGELKECLSLFRVFPFDFENASNNDWMIFQMQGRLVEKTKMDQFQSMVLAFISHIREVAAEASQLEWECDNGFAIYDVDSREILRRISLLQKIKQIGTWFCVPQSCCLSNIGVPEWWKPQFDVDLIRSVILCGFGMFNAMAKCAELSSEFKSNLSIMGEVELENRLIWLCDSLIPEELNQPGMQAGETVSISPSVKSAFGPVKTVSRTFTKLVNNEAIDLTASESGSQDENVYVNYASRKRDSGELDDLKKKKKIRSAFDGQPQITSFLVREVNHAK